MAYNKPFNPDALPRFAEPEPRQGSAQPPSNRQPSRYDTKPPPPLPRDQHPHPHAPAPRTSSAPLPHPQQQQQQQQQQKQQQYHHHHQQQQQQPPPSSRPVTAPHHSSLKPGRPPASPPQPAGSSSATDASLFPLFKAVNKDGSGQLSEGQLSAALVNGDWTPFDIETIRMMIRMFDSNRSGTINFDEFCGLWSFLISWRTLFDRFDVDRSGNISLNEFSDALVAFGYRLSHQFVERLFCTYDKRGKGVMSFDLFVQSCISLKRMTDVFKKYDDDRDGYITLSFENFLSEILKQK